MSKIKKLTIKEQLFVENYLQHFNGARAVREAGFKVTAHKEYACKILTKVDVKAAVDASLKKVCERNEVNQNKVVQDLLRMADAKMDDYVEVVRTEHEDQNGKVFATTEQLMLKDWDDMDTSMIKEIQQTKHGIKIKLYDRQKANETLSRYHGILIDNVKLEGNLNIKGFSDLVAELEGKTTKEENKDLFE